MLGLSCVRGPINRQILDVNWRVLIMFGEKKIHSGL